MDQIARDPSESLDGWLGGQGCRCDQTTGGSADRQGGQSGEADVAVKFAQVVAGCQQ